MDLVRNLARRPSAETSIDHLDRDNPRWNFPGFRVERGRCWGPISVSIINRASGEAICRSDCYRLTYFLTDFRSTILISLWL
jgi:hypothetical protein